jgi:predicted GH43/DUF377 family glycosyl hydrolase
MKSVGISLLGLVAGLYVFFAFNCETIVPEKPRLNQISIINERLPVKISGHKVFNAGILRLEDGYLYATRKRANSFLETFWKRYILKENIKGLCIGQLDSNFIQDSSSETTFCAQEGHIQYIDPRLIRVNNEIYMIYCSQINRSTRAASEAHLQLAKLEKTDDKWQIISDHRIHFDEHSQFEQFYEKGLVQKNFEKNWMPFSDNGSLYFVYLMEPDHVVLKVDVNSGSAVYCSSSPNPFPPMFSDARRSTPAVFDEELGEWITLFHFCIPSKRKITNKKANAYFFAGYTFSKDAPFNVLRKSKGPIAGSSLYENYYKIVFPTSLIRDGDDYLVFYGNDDLKNEVARISRKDLIESMNIVQEIQ